MPPFRQEVEQLTTIKDVSETREKMHFAELDITELQARAGSLDAEDARKAQIELYKKWQLRPEVDSQFAERVDLREQLKAFSNEQLIQMTKSSAGVQLTKGCNGNCYFCVYGKKDGVDAKFSFESLEWYIENYGQYLPQFNVFYWDSDPFDYRDGDKSFVDVYNIYRKVQPTQYAAISTALPKGSQDDFIKFSKQLAAEFKKTNGESSSKAFVRISVAKHNIQRVETTLKQLSQELLDEGYTASEVDTFLSKQIGISYRTEDRLDDLGDNVHKLDPYIPNRTVICAEGVVFAPQETKAVILTAPTTYHPAGLLEVPLTPENSKDTTPTQIFIPWYAAWDHKGALHSRTIYPTYSMVPRATVAGGWGRHLSLENPVDNVELQLGRDVYSYAYLLRDIYSLPFAETTKDAPIEQKKAYLVEALYQGIKRKPATEASIMQARTLLESGTLDDDKAQQLEFYILLAQAFMLKMDCVEAVGLTTNEDVKQTITIAIVLSGIGKAHIEQLPEIVEELNQLNITRKRGASDETLEQDARAWIGSIIGVASENDEKAPAWFKDLITNIKWVQSDKKKSA